MTELDPTKKIVYVTPEPLVIFKNSNEKCVVCPETNTGGMTWQCDAFLDFDPIHQKNHFFLSFKFTWDQNKVIGYKGMVQFVLDGVKSPHLPIQICRSGEWFDVDCGEERPIVEAGQQLTFNFCLGPIVNDFDGRAAGKLDSNRFKASELTDTELIVEGKTVHVSRVYLAYHSEYFRTMFFGAFKERNESVVNIEDVTYRDFAILLETIMPCARPPEVRDCEMLLELADRFVMPGVTRMVEQRLLSTTSSNGIRQGRIRSIAENYKLKALKRSIKHIKTHGN